MRSIRLALVLATVAMLAITGVSTALAGEGSGFDQYGYNDVGRVFNDTSAQWCANSGLASSCLDTLTTVYANDRLVMK